MNDYYGVVTDRVFEQMRPKEYTLVDWCLFGAMLVTVAMAVLSTATGLYVLFYLP